LPLISTVDEMVPISEIAAPGRGALSSSRLDEHLQATVKRLKNLGIRRGACVASALPDGPDAITAAMTARLAGANFAALAPYDSREKYQSLFLETDPKLLLVHSGAHPAREAARSLGIPVANVLRHFEAGIFTLEADIVPPWTASPPPTPAWKRRARGVPVVLIAPGPAYRRLANRLDATNPVVGITPPSLEHLHLPHTIEHIAAECVRILRRYRPHGPYALAGWRIDALVALEMARLLQEQGEKVAFVAMLNASALFHDRGSNPIHRALSSAANFFRSKPEPPSDLLANALRQYRPQPWLGKILHLRPSGPSDSMHSDLRLDWHQIAPHGFTAYEAPSEMLAEPNVHTVATILAAELVQVK
jgi:hypothetical protein